MNQLARLFNKLASLFKARRTYRLYVMDTDCPSKYTGITYPRRIIEREIGLEPFPVYFGRRQDYEGTFDPQFIPDKLVGTASDFRFEGNTLTAKLTIPKCPAGDTVQKLIKALGPEKFRIAAAGLGEVDDGLTVQDNFEIHWFNVEFK